LLTVLAALAVVALAASCRAGTGENGAGTERPGMPTPATVPAVSAEINQSRDSYSKQIVAIQLTNNTAATVTVLGAELGSTLFAATIAWLPSAGGIEIPPGQTKMLPAQLPAPHCGGTAASRGVEVTATLRLAGAPGASPGTTAAPGTSPGTTATPETSPGTASPGTTAAPMTVAASDPYGVLSRNNAEMCLAKAAAAVAVIRLKPDLELSADGGTAVVRLVITPRSLPGAVNPDAAGTLTIDRIDGTTLLEEDPAAPWPHSMSVRAGGGAQELRLGIRPARCDPHAVAEDKVGTLLPLRVHASGREGVLKIDAGPLLRGRIYDFVTMACRRQ
jgi:hypothetical protein